MEKFLLNPRRFKLFLSPQIDPKVAFPRRSNPKVRIASAPRVINWLVLTIFPQMVTRTKKIFVGGLSAATTLEEVKAYFQRFGEVSFSLLCFPSLSVAAQSLGTNQLPFAD